MNGDGIVFNYCLELIFLILVMYKDGPFSSHLSKKHTKHFNFLSLKPDSLNYSEGKKVVTGKWTTLFAVCLLIKRPSHPLVSNSKKLKCMAFSSSHVMFQQQLWLLGYLFGHPGEVITPNESEKTPPHGAEHV